MAMRRQYFGSTDPTDPQAAGGQPIPMPGGPEVSPSGPSGPQVTPDPTSPSSPIPPGVTPTFPTPSPTGGTPSTLGGGSAGGGSDNRSRADALLSKYGYKDNGRGSGFGDESYWLDVINGLSGSAADNMWRRWENDLSGKGTDNPGPGDAGNTSRDPNAGGVGGSLSGLIGGLVMPGGSPSYQGSSLPSVVSPNMGSDSSFLDQILSQLQQFGGGLNPIGKK